MQKKSILFVFHALLMVLLTVPAFAADTVKLAENGKALATIEIAPDASATTRSLATEVALYLERISGARFEVANKPGAGARIVLGRNNQFPDYKQGDRLRGNGPEAFVMRTAGDRVLLLGVTDRAASHAAFTFLEKLGVRWFFPTEEWEIVPNVKTLTANFDEVQRPDISLHRDIWYGSMTGYTIPNHLRLDWMRRNRMKVDGPNTSHSWVGLDPVKDFAENPEWFALVGGKRQASKPNYGHPEVIKRAVASSLQAAEKGAASISVSAPDGLGFCECDQCLQVAGVSRESVHKINSAVFGKRPDGELVCVTSETIFRMANAVATEVGKKYPNTLIGVFAYSGYAHPPSFDLAPNIYVAVTSAYRRTPLSFDDQIRIYSAKSKQLGIYDYYNIAVWGTGLNPGKGVKMSDLAERIPFYHANSVLGINAEATNNWLPSGLDYYVSSKLMWNVQTDVNAVYADFLDKAFGPAKAPMKSYYDRWESKAELNQASLGASIGNLMAAYRMADSDAVRTRIAQLYLYNRVLRLEMAINDAVGAPEEAASATAEYPELVFRTKDTMLLHDLVTGKVNRPLVPGYTDQELKQLMADDTAWIERNRTVFLSYSRNLVPITTARQTIAGVKEQPHEDVEIRNFHVIVPAQAGETVEMTVAPRGATARYRVIYMPREDFVAAASTSLGEAVTSGETPDKLSFKAEKTGFYRVIWNEASLVSVNRPYALDSTELRHATLYFYVPAGTTKFRLKTKAHGGPTVTVKDATGKIVYQLEGNRAGKKGVPDVLDTNITVPPGTDGAVWSVSGPGDGTGFVTIELIGVPKYFSLSPHQMLVAQEYLQ